MPPTVPEQARSFLDYLTFQKRYSRHTVIAYSNDLAAFFSFLEQQFGATPLTEISPAMVRSWLAGLKEEGMDSRSVNRKISSLKSFFKFCLRQGAVTSSPLTTVVSPKVRKKLPRFVEEEGTRVLFRHVEFPEGWLGRTQRLILLLFYQTGMRQAELVNLKETQLDAGNRQIKVLGKGNKERILPAGPELIQEIKGYLEEKRRLFEPTAGQRLLVTPKGAPLYPRFVYNTVKQYLSAPGVTTLEKRSPHVLRHTFATHLMNNGADINAVKELLGHSSLAATQVYTHNSIEKLREVYKKAHPKA